MLRRSRGAAGMALLALGLFLATPGVVLAEDTSNHLMPILRMGVGTRALGMGGAAVAAGHDATGAYYNPALLGWACGSQLSAMHALGMEEDRRMSFVAASHRMDWGGIGASFITAGLSDIEERDPSGNYVGTFDYGDMALMLHGAYITDYASFGATFKYLHQGLDANVPGDDGVGGIGFDFGMAMQPIEWARIGVAARDVASSIGGDEDADNVPFNLRAGVAIMPLYGFTLAFDIDHTDDEDMKYHAGGEVAMPITEDIGGAMRLGLNNDNLTLGVGLSVKMVSFDYAFIDEPEEFLGESHRIGVTLKLCEEECPFEKAPRSVSGGRAMRDRDQDGIPDDTDACPTAAEDFDGFEDTDGCPDVDNDGDGILDVNDDCPNRAEDFDGFQDRDGCPDVDNDGDGILDKDDRCPNAAETFNQFEDTDGCPDEVPTQLPAAYINFKFNSAQISSADPVPILNDVADFMKRHPNLRLRIVGHTDNVGSEAYNMDLSMRRAESVKSYLVSQGVDGARMMTDGKGESEPIDTNNTEEGRARNRRIEFHIIN